MQPKLILEDYKEYLKQLILENITGARFIKSYRVNEPVNICCNRTESQAVDISMTHNNVDDLNILFKAGKIIRKELQSHPRWRYKGSFDDFEHPKLLSTFLRWVLVGPNLSTQNKIRTHRIL